MYCSTILWYFPIAKSMLTCFACTLQNNAQFVVKATPQKKHIHLSNGYIQMYYGCLVIVHGVYMNELVR